MSATRTERFRNEFRRLRASFASGESEEGTDERDHVVLSNLTIGELMEGNLATVLPDSSVHSAVRLMIEHRVSSVPVVDAEGRVVGALNEGDLMQVFYEPQTKRVADVMTRKPIVVSIDAPLVDVVDHLMSSNFRRVLICRDDRLVGVITRSHVMPALLAALEAIGAE